MRMKNPNRVAGGKEAKERGTLAEQEFDYACRYYRGNCLLDWQPTYPEFVVVKRSSDGTVRGFFKEKGSADRVISLVQLDGQTCWVEIKSFLAKDRHTLDKGIHQYDQMLASIEDGGAMAFYITRWEWHKEVEWRLYELPALVKNDGKIIFKREAGWFVPSPLGWPDWLPVLLS